MINQEMLIEKIFDYLNGLLSERELVLWAEDALVQLFETDAEVSDEENVIEVLTYIGAGDSPGFPLTWSVLMQFLNQLGAKAHVVREAV
jgi:hypothetical protein